MAHNREWDRGKDWNDDYENYNSYNSYNYNNFDERTDEGNQYYGGKRRKFNNGVRIP